MVFHGITFGAETLHHRGGDVYVGFMRIYLHQAPHLAMQVWEWKSSIFHFQLNFEGFVILAATFACAGPVGVKQFVSHICVAQGRVFLLESKALQNPPGLC